MREITAAEAERRFSEILDAVEHEGDAFLVRRGANVVATIAAYAPTREAPDHKPTGKDLMEFLRANPPDAEWLEEILEVRRFLGIAARE